MGRGGSNKKSARLHVLEGTGRPSRLNRNGPKPRPAAPSRPRWLPKEARKEWARVAPALEKMGLLTELDRAAFAGYCCSWADYVEAQRLLAAEGVITEGVGGKLKKHPAVTIAARALDQLRAWCQEFGMTPSARGRVSVGTEEPREEPSWLD